MTRAEMRDAIRRRLGQVAAVDVGGEVGDGLPTHPTPTNHHINAAINEALADLNRYCNIGETGPDIRIDVPASTDGPVYRLDITRLNIAHSITSVQQVRSVVWRRGEHDTILRPTHRSAIDRDAPSWRNSAAGEPECWWIENEDIIIHPAPASAGTLHVRCTTSLMLADLDHATIGMLPSDYHPVVCDIAARDLAASMPDDAEMASRLQILGPRAEAGREDILRWYATRSTGYKPAVTVHTYR